MDAQFYEKHHKKGLILTIIIIIAAFLVIGYYYNTQGDFFKKDVSLAGGTSITIATNEEIDLEALELSLSNELEQVSVRLLADATTKNQQGILIDTSATDVDAIVDVLHKHITFDERDLSLESTGPSLGASFYKDLILTLIIAFVLMAVSVMISFRSFIPSVAVIAAAVMDIVVTVAILNILSIKVAAGGIVALLLVIGYSIDTDVLLTTKMLKRTEDEPFQRLKSGAKTGLTMTITTIAALLVAYLVSFHPLLKQMFLIIIIALVVDIIATYLMNASILYWYVTRRKK